MNIRNPFRDQVKRTQFDKVLLAYQQKKSVLFLIRPDIGPCGRAGNGWSSCFWAGYDGMVRGVRVPAKNLPAYVFYAAGRAIRAAEDQQVAA
ncbi:MAG: hypothetical protein RJA36_3564 [Pseudomonadota bacterium]|jgi:hypothetical protein